jgi:hypothetical protein
MTATSRAMPRIKRIANGAYFVPSYSFTTLMRFSHLVTGQTVLSHTEEVVEPTAGETEGVDPNDPLPEEGDANPKSR